jgi:hypothetical protein
MEGQLFREVVIEAAEKQGRSAPCAASAILCDAAKKLTNTDAAIRKTLTEIGRGVEGGWRAEQKAAALSAWMLLK